MPLTAIRMLSVNAHPHDFTHTAGTLGIHTSEGDKCTVVSVTTGAKTHNEALHDELMKPVEEQDPKIINQSEAELVSIKERELKKACGVFGVSDVRTLGFPQPFHLDSHPESVKMIRDVILDVRPHVLIMQSPYNMRSRKGRPSVIEDDHIETARATLAARREAGEPRQGVTPHSIPCVLFPGVYFERDEYDFTVDVTEWFEQRVEAEAAYVSQGHTLAWSRVRMQNALGPVGWQSQTRYAEAFVREKLEVFPRIPISELSIQLSESPIHTRYSRMIGTSK